jgi:hypothetical protein
MPNNRYASFDYCFNYFQSFRESREISALAHRANVQNSCLHLGFYLASWGMYRGSTQLLKNSLRYLVPLIKVVAGTDASLWKIDAHCYTESNIDRLWQLRCAILQAYPKMTPALLTKSMLGVFGNVPAFDTNFRQGCRAAGIASTFGPKALEQIGVFYQENAAVIDSYRHQLPTLDFVTGKHTKRCYTRAKLIDMAFFIEGGA